MKDQNKLSHLDQAANSLTLTFKNKKNYSYRQVVRQYIKLSYLFLITSFTTLLFLIFWIVEVCK